MDEVVWLWEMAQRIRREAPDQVRIAVSHEKADECWAKAVAGLRHLMSHGGTSAEWDAAYQAFKACDALERGDHSV
jgi:hypothetical protein